MVAPEEIVGRVCNSQIEMREFGWTVIAENATMDDTTYNDRSNLEAFLRNGSNSTERYDRELSSHGSVRGFLAVLFGTSHRTGRPLSR